MNKLLFILLSVGFCFCGYGQVIITGWTFDTLSSAPNTPKTYPSTLGSQLSVACLYANGSNGSSDWNSNELNSYAGTLINDPRGGSAMTGKAYSLQNMAANGKSIVLKFSMTGYEGAVLTYATQKTSTGFNAQQWSYSTDSATFTPIGPVFTPPASYSVQTLDLSGVGSINGAFRVWLKMTVSGSTSASGNNRLDNFVVNASLIPFPTNLAVISVNGGSTAIAGMPFNVVVQAQDDENNPCNVTSDAGVLLSSATGTAGGNLTGTILSGQSTATISGVTMTEGYPQTITAHQVSGTPSLTDGTSDPFYVISPFPDYRTKSGGNWNAVSTWQIKIAGNWYDAWDFPDAANKSVTILNGHEVTVTGNQSGCKNLSISSGGKLWANSSSNAYCVGIYGNITNNGIIGSDDGELAKDLVSFYINGANCTITGSGIFDAGRISKNSADTSTDLVFCMNVILRYTSVSEAALYNAMPGTTSLNIIINPGSGIRCTGAGIDLTGCTLALESDSSGTAGIIDNGTILNNSNIRVKRFLSGYSSPGDSKYHILSSPVNSQMICPEFVSIPPDPAVDFFKWDEPSSVWINCKDNSGNWNPSFENSFLPGRGYLVAYPSSTEKIFNGSLNTYPAGSPLTYPCTWTDPENGGSGGWNMLGNPFPSSLDWDLVNHGDGIDNALYYYDPAIQNYRYYLNYLPGISVGNGSRFIPPEQGFFVHANSTGQDKTIAFNNSMRVLTGLSAWYKENLSEPDNYLVLQVENETMSDETAITFFDQSTPGFDGDYDAFKLMSMDPVVPEIYTVSTDNINLAINALPVSGSTASIPVGFRPGSDGQYTLTASGMNSFSQGTGLIIEDILTMQTQDLMDDPVYSFTSTVNDDQNRFILHFSGLSGVDHRPGGNGFCVYSSNHQLFISQNNPWRHGKIVVFNMLGEVILSINFQDQALTRIDLSGRSGYFIVRVVCGNESKAFKIFLE